MKIKSNTLKAVKTYFLNELNEIYGENEISAFYKSAASHYLSIPFENFNLHADKRLSESELLKFIYCVKDLKKHKPIQYILQSAWFGGFEFYVNSGVLIPRPETEEMVFNIIKKHKNDKAFRIIDFCTGSGCIAITLKNKLPQAEVIAIDLYDAALQIAGFNQQKHNTNIQLIQADVLNLNDDFLNESVDIIVSNPPYVLKSEKNEIAKHVIEHEPHEALFVLEGNDEIIFYKKIIEYAEKNLKSKGCIYFEINPLAIDVLSNYCNTKSKYFSYRFENDLSGNIRFLHLIKV